MHFLSPETDFCSVWGREWPSKIFHDQISTTEGCNLLIIRQIRIQLSHQGQPMFQSTHTIKKSPDIFTQIINFLLKLAEKGLVTFLKCVSFVCISEEKKTLQFNKHKCFFLSYSPPPWFHVTFLLRACILMQVKKKCSFVTYIDNPNISELCTGMRGHLSSLVRIYSRFTR